MTKIQGSKNSIKRLQTAVDVLLLKEVWDGPDFIMYHRLQEAISREEELIISKALQEYVKSAEFQEDFNQELSRANVFETHESYQEIIGNLILSKERELKAQYLCANYGHDWTSTCDGENGAERIECTRCGESYTYHF